MAEDEGFATGEEAAAFLRDRAVYPPRDELQSTIDMVMKGGITSGVVYPLAVCELAQRHAFRSLGGSSAGGIAAAMAAAAELARGSGGFNRLADLPAALGDDLLAIFQPSPATRPLFNVLLAGLGRPTLRRTRVLLAVVRGAVWWFVAAMAAVLVLSLVALVLVAGAPRTVGDWAQLALRGSPLLVPAVLVGAIAAGAGLLLTGKRRLEGNGYGLCRGSNGQSPPRGSVEPFADWLHVRLQRVAGLDGDQVLTFGHLWGDTGAEELPEEPAIRLEMMTTNVTHCRPVRLPFESDLYYFCPDEVADYFPKAVFEHLVDHSRPSTSGDEWECPDHEVPLVHLPHPGQVPVLAAVRLTLSFPVLISAVPLFAIDRAAKPHRPVRCWFSDGGISSNFPIHFFDALWPGHPTFGISLGPYPAGMEERHVYLRDPKATAHPRVRETGSLTAFVSALVDTLQNWSDEGQSTLPGYRDRIVEVRHTDEEGGFNLKMTREEIMRLAWKGYLAGRELERFTFDHHRWARYRTAMAELDKATADMASKYDAPLPNGDRGYRAFVTDLPEGSGDDPGIRWREKAVRRTDLLLAFAGRQADGSIDPPEPDFPKEEPRPAPDLRVVAHF